MGDDSFITLLIKHNKAFHLFYFLIQWMSRILLIQQNVNQLLTNLQTKQATVDKQVAADYQKKSNKKVQK